MTEIQIFIHSLQLEWSLQQTSIKQKHILTGEAVARSENTTKSIFCGNFSSCGSPPVFLYRFPGTFFALFFFPALAALQSAAAPPDTILPVSPDIIFLFVIARFFAQEFEKKFFVFFIAPHIVFYVVFTTIRAHSDKNILYFIYNRLS